MPRIKLTKSSIDALPTPASDVVYWDTGCPGFGVKITPKGRKVFVVLYRTRRRRLEAAKIHYRTIRACHAPSGACGGAEGVRREAGRSRSRSRETRG
jgi:hypothetical protein